MSCRLYIFDMGGVLARNFNVRPVINQYLRISDEQFSIYAGAELRLFSDGKISSGEFWEVFSGRYGLEIREDLYAKFFHPEIDDRVKEIIIELKKKTRVVCGTNTIEPHYNSHLKQGDYEIFDLVYASHQMGVSKPDPEFYRYILAAERMEAAATVFVDDTEDNVAAALNLGMKAILFRDPDSLLDSLNGI